MLNLTELQQNFIRRACEVYDLMILEEIMDVPNDYTRVPDWAHSEIFDLVELLDEESEEK